MAKPGRPSKLDINLINTICKVLKTGATDKLACGGAGISQETFIQYRTKGEQDTKNGKKTIYSVFSESIKRAKLEGHHSIWGKLLECAGQAKDWKAYMTILERTLPDDFGRTQKLEVKTTSEQADNAIAEVFKKSLRKSSK